MDTLNLDTESEIDRLNKVVHELTERVDYYEQALKNYHDIFEQQIAKLMYFKADK